MRSASAFVKAAMSERVVAGGTEGAPAEHPAAFQEVLTGDLAARVALFEQPDGAPLESRSGGRLPRTSSTTSAMGMSQKVIPINPHASATLPQAIGVSGIPVMAPSGGRVGSA